MQDKSYMLGSLPAAPRIINPASFLPLIVLSSRASLSLPPCCLTMPGPTCRCPACLPHHQSPFTYLSRFPPFPPSPPYPPFRPCCPPGISAPRPATSSGPTPAPFPFRPPRQPDRPHTAPCPCVACTIRLRPDGGLTINNATGRPIVINNPGEPEGFPAGRPPKSETGPAAANRPGTRFPGMPGDRSCPDNCAPPMTRESDFTLFPGTSSACDDAACTSCMWDPSYAFDLNLDQDSPSDYATPQMPSRPTPPYWCPRPPPVRYASPLSSNEYDYDYDSGFESGPAGDVTTSTHTIRRRRRTRRERVRVRAVRGAGRRGSRGSGRVTTRTELRGRRTRGVYESLSAGGTGAYDDGCTVM
jgi:hypothetical protein